MIRNTARAASREEQEARGERGADGAGGVAYHAANYTGSERVWEIIKARAVATKREPVRVSADRGGFSAKFRNEINRRSENLATDGAD
jgi:hypothetical protein